MRSTALVVAVFALPLVLAAFAVGWTLSGLNVERPQAAPPSQPVSATSSAKEAVGPRAAVGKDVPGKDLAGLPRPPGSTRAGYRQERLEGFARTRLEYVTEAASPNEIRAFYRRSFASEGWVVADLGFSPEEWYFFVVKDEREALVEIHALRSPVVVEIELTGPGETPANDAPAPQPVDPVSTAVLEDGENDPYEGEDD